MGSRLIVEKRVPVIVIGKLTGETKVGEEGLKVTSVSQR